MKKILSIFIAAMMAVSLYPQIIIADSGGNMLADGDIETADEIPNGDWKPGTGAWKSGLGTSVTIDTETVSENNSSTKSVKITNAAIQQGVTLGNNNSYTLSFDIYLKDSFDASKLSWGIYNFNGSYAGDVVYGYKEGASVTESNFDESVIEQWQSVSIDFECTAAGNYITEFYYGSKTDGDCIYIDNVSLVCTTEIPPDTQDGMLINAGFEGGTLYTGGAWRFTGADGGWYGESNAALDYDTVHTGDRALKLNSGAAGQRVNLEAGKKYKLKAYVYPTKFYASGVYIGFYDGSQTYPMSNEVEVGEIPIDWTNEWVEYSIIFECTSTKDYVIGAYVSSTAGSDVYFDDFVLEETDEEEIVTAKEIAVDYNTQSDITYNKEKLLNVSRGGHMALNNENFLPSYYDKFAEDGINMIRMDWVLADIFYEIVSRDENGELTYDFTYLDNTILPMLEKGMTPYMCMDRFPQAIGGGDIFGAPYSSIDDLTEYGEIIGAVVKHYADMGYTGWYWESHNEPEKGYMGNVYQICEQYGVFAKAVKAADPTAKIGGIGYRNGDVSKESDWKTVFFSYLQNNPDVPIDFVSIHVYNEVTHFSASDSYVDLMKEYGLEDIPIIFSEWNYDWTTGVVGSEKDTNVNAAYGAKRMFTAIANDNVDFVFYFTPADAWQPDQLMNGDSGLYTIDGHRKAAANMFAMYNDLESECLQTEAQLKMNQNAMTYGLITKNSDIRRVTALLFNYSDSENDIDIQISDLPYEGNVKLTTKIIDADSGNYCADYLEGLRGYSETPNELPDTYVEVRSNFSDYSETITMASYSVMELILEPTDEAVHENMLQSKSDPDINIAINKAVTASSEDVSDPETNAKEQAILWGADKLTDGYRLSFDIVDNGTTNIGYRSERFDEPENAVQLTVDLQEIMPVNTVRLYPVNDKLHGGEGMPVDFTIDVSDDGSAWTTVYSENGFDNNGSYEPKSIVFPTVNARYVRLNAEKLSQAADGYRLQLAEIEVYDMLDTENDSEYLDILDGFKEILTIEKLTNEDGTKLLVSLKNDEGLPELTLYTAVYSRDASLKNIDAVTYRPDENGMIEILLSEPQLGEDESYKFMLWNDNQNPVIGSVTDEMNFFE